jgi:hypothetical protein
MTDPTRTDRPDCTERPATEETLKAPSLVRRRPSVNWFGLALWIFGYAACPRGEQLKEVGRG